ncbi:hypothetical protein EJ08DRAFT_739766 [Tothia fuscella]|uniref:Uncharacterized protein n=1 Tax=Tothia fuscella TaxID=1048955 RepID=A0A9P4NDU9_9PEZI|nr:hypothetical protein EJ08DRAFT_739766 [Tothia fuscella]
MTTGRINQGARTRPEIRARWPRAPGGRVARRKGRGLSRRKPTSPTARGDTTPRYTTVLGFPRGHPIAPTEFPGGPSATETVGPVGLSELRHGTPRRRMLGGPSRPRAAHSGTRWKTAGSRRPGARERTRGSLLAVSLRPKDRSCPWGLIQRPRLARPAVQGWSGASAEEGHRAAEQPNPIPDARRGLPGGAPRARARSPRDRSLGRQSWAKQRRSLTEGLTHATGLLTWSERVPSRAAYRQCWINPAVRATPLEGVK